MKIFKEFSLSFVPVNEAFFKKNLHQGFMWPVRGLVLRKPFSNYGDHGLLHINVF